MANNKSRSTRIEDAGVLRRTKFTRDGVTYGVFETRPKRMMDKYRFELRKEGEVNAYVVSFQDVNGDRAQCSCKGWIFRRQDCKHCKMCRAEFFTASPRRQPAAAAPIPSRALPDREDQLAFPGMDELSELTQKLNELRGSYKGKKIEIEAAEALLSSLKIEMTQIEHDGNVVKGKVQILLKNRGEAA